MPTLLNVTMVGDKELVLRFRMMPSRVRESLLRKTYELAFKLEAKVKDTKLSGQVLKVVTGALRRSIQNQVTATDTMVRGKVYSAGDVKYAGIHEFGGKTPPHVIVPNKAKALAFMMGGKQVFAAYVNHPGSTMPERSYMRSSLAEMETEIVAGYKEAAREAVNVK